MKARRRIVVLGAVADLTFQPSLIDNTMATATVTPELHRQIAAAIEAIPTAHREPPEDGIVVADPSSAFHRVQD